MEQNKEQPNANLAGSNVNATSQSDFLVANSTSTLKINLEDFKYYEVDFDKVNTLEDIKCILQSVNIMFSKQSTNFDKVKHLLKDVE